MLLHAGARSVALCGARRRRFARLPLPGSVLDVCTTSPASSCLIIPLAELTSSIFFFHKQLPH